MADDPSKAVRLFERLIRDGVIPLPSGVATAMASEPRAVITREFPVFATGLAAAASGRWEVEAEKVGEQSLIYDAAEEPISAPIALPNYERATIPDARMAPALAEAIGRAHSLTGADADSFRTLRFNDLGIFAVWVPDRLLIPIEIGAYQDTLEQGREYPIEEIVPIIREIARQRIRDAAAAAKPKGEPPRG